MCINISMVQVILCRQCLALLPCTFTGEPVTNGPTSNGPTTNGSTTDGSTTDGTTTKSTTGNYIRTYCSYMDIIITI